MLIDNNDWLTFLSISQNFLDNFFLPVKYQSLSSKASVAYHRRSLILLFRRQIWEFECLEEVSSINGDNVLSWFTETSCESYNSLSFKQIRRMIYKLPFVLSFFNNSIVMIQEWLVNLVDNEYCILPLRWFKLRYLIESDEYNSFLAVSLRWEFNWYILIAMLLEEGIL